MRKKLFVLVLIIFAVFALFTACDNESEGKREKLATPTALTITGTTLTWTEVSNASSYLIRIGTDIPIPSDSNSYSLADLSIAKVYYISVQAAGNGKDYIDSEWSIEKEYVSVKINFQKNDGIGTADSITVAYKSTYGALPSNLTRTGFTFAGWWTGEGDLETEVTSDTTVLNAMEHTLKAKWLSHFTFLYSGGNYKISGLTALGKNLSI